MGTLTEQEFKVTYYVGLMLAQGGSLVIKEDCLLFAPRSIERAMGAVDVTIPYDRIKLAEVTGTITETLVVRTAEKPHKFVGGDLYKIADTINAALEAYQQRRPAGPTVSQPLPASTNHASAVPVEKKETPPRPASNLCPACQQAVETGFNFCPSCQASLRKSCPACHRPANPGWKFCPACSAAV